MKATYELMDGWEAEVEETGGLDELVLRQVFNSGFREAWRMQIPPKANEAELISSAKMLAVLFQKAWETGVQDAKQWMAEAADALIEETGGWEEGGDE